MAGPVTNAVAGPLPCLVCEADVWRVPQDRYDWMWIDAQGRAMARKTMFRYRLDADGNQVDWLIDENPYRRLGELRAKPHKEWTPEDVTEYTALRVWEMPGQLSLHTHVALPTVPDGGPLEFHCGRVMYLTPSGWICRSCDFGRDA